MQFIRSNDLQTRGLSRNLDLSILDITFRTFLCPRGFEGGGRGDGEGDDEEEDEAPQELLLVCR